MQYFLDTNIIIYAMKGLCPALEQHFRAVPASSIFIPTVVLAEIEFGSRKSFSYEKTKRIYQPFLDAFEHISFTDKAAHTYGKIRCALEKAGTPIGPQ